MRPVANKYTEGNQAVQQGNSLINPPDFRNDRSNPAKQKSSLFDKIATRKDIARSKPRHKGQVSSKSRFSDDEEEVGLNGSNNRGEERTVSPEPALSPEQSNVSRDTDLVYRPGVGIIRDHGSPARPIPTPKRQRTTSLLNSSLDFYDPYNNSVPEATSPSKAHLDETFDYNPFRPVYEPDEPASDTAPPSSQDSTNASLIIEEASTASDPEDDPEETLLSDDGSPEIHSDEDDEELVAPFAEEDEPALPFSEVPEPGDSESSEYQSPFKDVFAKSESDEPVEMKPRTLWRDKDLVSTRDQEVFGTNAVSPVKVKKTFGKRKSTEVVEIVDEDDIMKKEFQKVMDEEKRLKGELRKSEERRSRREKEHIPDRETGNETDSDKPRRPSRRANKIVTTIIPITISDTSGSQESTPTKNPPKTSAGVPVVGVPVVGVPAVGEIRMKSRDMKLEEIKNLKARIFEKQWRQNKEDSSSSSSNSSSSSSDESQSDESDSESSSESSQHNSDSDFSINSNESVKSLTEEPDTSGSGTEKSSTARSQESSSHVSVSCSQSSNSESETVHQRKRKRLTSPRHAVGEEDSLRRQSRPKPVLSLTPRQMQDRKEEKDRQQCLKERAPSRKRSPSRGNPSRQTISVDLSAPSCKLKHKEIITKDSGRLREKHKKKKDLSEFIKSEKKKAILAEGRKSSRRDERKHNSKREEHLKESSKRKHSKPGVTDSIKSDKIIPHQHKLSQKKMKILEKYDARMGNSSMTIEPPQAESSNLKSFYGQKPTALEKKSKYSREVC